MKDWSGNVELPLAACYVNRIVPKGKVSPVLYVAGILLAFVNTWISDAIYVVVALLWLLPDRRIEGVFDRP